MSGTTISSAIWVSVRLLPKCLVASCGASFVLRSEDWLLEVLRCRKGGVVCNSGFFMLTI